MLSRQSIFLLLCLFAPAMTATANQPGTLAFATLEWKGKYRTEDVANGVKQTPATGSIYSISDDGTAKRKIVDLGGTTTNPHFGPLGDWVYFQSNGSGRYQVYRCRPNGSDVTNLSELHNLGDEWNVAYGLELSGNGEKLVYTVHDGTSGRVVYCKADGTQAQWVAPELGYTYMASLDHTGDRIVFSGPAKGYRLMLAAHPFTDAELLTPDHPESFVPQFTPDGNTIVFIRRDGDIYSLDLRDRQIKRLTEGNQYGEFRLSDEDRHGSTDGPSLSPDGKRIAYIAKKSGVPQVCMMNIDGSEQQQITQRKTACGRVRWSPDGQQLAFVSFVKDLPQLFVVNAAGGKPRQLTRGPAVNCINWLLSNEEQDD
jgi:Tol biopolymer transport system component